MKRFFHFSIIFRLLTTKSSFTNLVWSFSFFPCHPSTRSAIRQPFLAREHDRADNCHTCKQINTSDIEQQLRTTTHSYEKSSLISSAENEFTAKRQLRRVLGAQELLMLPRQYGLRKDVKFPCLTGTGCLLLNVTPDPELLLQAIQIAMDTHPLLAAHVEGTGEPEKYIDSMKFVRKGEKNPLTFVVDDNKPTCSAMDVLTVIDTATDEENLEKSWKSSFDHYIDDSAWCNISTGPLWKVELHTISSPKRNKNNPCALVFTSNHAVCDLTSNNQLTDLLLRTVADFEENMETDLGINNKHKRPKRLEMPISIEDSVLGLNQRWNDIQTRGFSIKTLQYVFRKTLEGFKRPAILPDESNKRCNKPHGNPFEKLFSMTPRQKHITIGGNDTKSITVQTKQRKSVLQYRILSKEKTTALLHKCRENGVTVSCALAAAMTLTVSDFVNQKKNKSKKRYYKILQSLDMRRFGAKLDKGLTCACMAGSNDLMFGPIRDLSGTDIRQHIANDTITNSSMLLQDFWNLAHEAKLQTFKFMKDSVGPVEAVRVFDFGMSISELTNFIYIMSQSKKTKGRMYSGGVTYGDSYERYPCFIETDNEDSKSVTYTNNKKKRFHQRCKIQHGRYRIQAIFYAASHAQTGCLYPMSSMIVDDKLCITFNPVSPIVTEETTANFADAYMELLEVVAGVSQPVSADATVSNSNIFDGKNINGICSRIDDNILESIKQSPIKTEKEINGGIIKNVQSTATNLYFTDFKGDTTTEREESGLDENKESFLNEGTRDIELELVVS